LHLIEDSITDRRPHAQHAHTARTRRAPQTADVLGQRFGEHVDAPLHQVRRRRARRRLVVHRRPRAQKVRHVGDVHADLVVAVGEQARVQRVVNVLAAGRVDGAHRQVAQVLAGGGDVVVGLSWHVPNVDG
jgi:hypothetical protein